MKKFQIGDRIELSGRSGELIEVVQIAGRRLWVVRWDDGTKSGVLESHLLEEM